MKKYTCKLNSPNNFIHSIGHLGWTISFHMSHLTPIVTDCLVETFSLPVSIQSAILAEVTTIAYRMSHTMTAFTLLILYRSSVNQPTNTRSSRSCLNPHCQILFPQCALAYIHLPTPDRKPIPSNIPTSSFTLL